MHTLLWSSAMELGHAGMDESHRLLFESLGRLARLADREFTPAWGALVQRLEADFREEEALMERLAHPGLRAHREQHASMLAPLHRATGALLRGDPAPARQALAQLPHWFVLHIVSMDLALAEAAANPLPPALRTASGPLHTYN
ncbi:bacteriohemerythrin [Pseudoduganella namucuonensis]|uniref:Hemerythrin n=1 Tax=Pseudoduganella namucuonensis TaxID=1035707 RepID=A0A1I7KP41_9BURK|nr:hemerythrin family protein [Pseudoduganella namucuonensis]SFU99191.1 hemerythrin [Pseudoduganella namucuonensis]